MGRPRLRRPGNDAVARRRTAEKRARYGQYHVKGVTNITSKEACKIVVCSKIDTVRDILFDCFSEHVESITSANALTGVQLTSQKVVDMFNKVRRVCLEGMCGKPIHRIAFAAAVFRVVTNAPLVMISRTLRAKGLVAPENTIRKYFILVGDRMAMSDKEEIASWFVLAAPPDSPASIVSMATGLTLAKMKSMSKVGWQCGERYLYRCLLCNKNHLTRSEIGVEHRSYCDPKPPVVKTRPKDGT